MGRWLLGRGCLKANGAIRVRRCAAGFAGQWVVPGGTGKSVHGLLFSEAIMPYAEAVGQTGAQGPVRGCGPHCPPVPRKDPARDQASEAPRAGRGSASFPGLMSRPTAPMCGLTRSSFKSTKTPVAPFRLLPSWCARRNQMVLGCSLLLSPGGGPGSGGGNPISIDQRPKPRKEG